MAAQSLILDYCAGGGTAMCRYQPDPNHRRGDIKARIQPKAAGGRIAVSTRFWHDFPAIDMYYGERFNSVSHLLGAVAGLFGLVALVVLAAREGDAWKIVSFSIYGSTLFFLYATSTAYHCSRGRLKQIFRTLDHHAIYLLIAGTYTPFALVTLRDDWGWIIFAAIWALAVFGIILESRPKKGKRILPIAIYLIMGWIILLALIPLLRELSFAGFLWLLAGGLLYSFGVIFYVLSHRKHFHGIWHLFVLAGSAAHYIAVFQYVR